MNAAFLLCLLFLPADQKVVNIDVYSGKNILQSIQLERTDTGLDMYFRKGNDRRKVASFLTKGDPFVFEADLQGIDGTPEQFDLRDARKAVRPWDSKTEKQELKALDKRIVAVRQGTTIGVTFDGAAETFVTAMTTAWTNETTSKPTSQASNTTSAPASQPASFPTSRPVRPGLTTRPRPQPTTKSIARPKGTDTTAASAPATGESPELPVATGQSPLRPKGTGEAPAPARTGVETSTVPEATSEPAAAATAPPAATASQPAKVKSATGLEAVSGFFSALAGGKAADLAGYYAKTATVKKGSTILEERWGLDCTVDSHGDAAAAGADIAAAYAALIADRGLAQWAKGFAPSGRQIVPSIDMVDEADKPLPGCRKGDVAVEIKAFGKRSTFVFRPGASGAWAIVIERSSY